MSRAPCPLQREALAIRLKAFDAEHPVVARSLNALGQVLVEKGALAEAEPLLRRAYAIRLEGLPVRHLDIASTQANLGLS